VGRGGRLTPTSTIHCLTVGSHAVKFGKVPYECRNKWCQKRLELWLPP